MVEARCIRIDGIICRDDEGDCAEIEDDLLDALNEVVERFGCGMLVQFGTKGE